MGSTLIIGFGAVGQAVTRRLIDTESPVTVLARSNRPVPAGADLVVGDAASATDLLRALEALSLIHISEPTRRRGISYAVFCLTTPT